MEDIKEGEIVGHSPLPQKSEVVASELKRRPMPFSEALRLVVKDHKIARGEWEDKSIYGFMKLGILMIHLDGSDRQWILSDGDIQGEDWYIVK
jgi:hypothetical protein